MTEGQVLALEQLRDISAAGSALEIVAVREPDQGRANLVAEVSIDCRGLERRAGGIPLRSRERLVISIPAGFPFELPSVETTHRRFAGFPHVQWGHHFCLYQAPATEWNPSDGMYGFAERLSSWLEHAARGELDPAGAPLHPPVAYLAGGPYRMVIPRANAPAAGNTPWFGYAHLRVQSEWRVDITGWSPVTSTDAPESVAAVVLLTEPMPFEFPSNVADLIAALTDRGVSRQLLFLTLQSALLRNNEAAPLFVIIGTPMRGIAGSSDLKQHLTAWYVDSIGIRALRLELHRYSENPALAEIGREVERLLLEWASIAPITWCHVREDRPEIVTRRDHASRVAWFRGRTVAIWGCGALGGHIAEFLTRAGVEKLILDDNNTVAPGLLARQPYDDRDLGRFKAVALAERLRRIRPDLEVETRTTSILGGPLDGDDWTDRADVLLDTTASNSVRAKLERRLRHRETRRIPIVSMMISHDAERGIVAVAHPSHSGGAVDVVRRAKLEACNRTSLAGFADAFWSKERRQIFQPEPGCSDPTFVGSAADAAALAGMMLNLAAEALGDESAATARAAFIAQPRLESHGTDFAISSRCPPDVVIPDPESGYEIRITQGAWADIGAWRNRARRTAGHRVETGGLLFGERDDASQVIWVTEITGPPPDSEASEHGFICGVKGTEEANTEKRKRSRDSVAYLGMWHTHPGGAPLPSATDFGAMKRLLDRAPDAPGKLLMLIIGGSESRPLASGFIFKKGDFALADGQQAATRTCAVLRPESAQPSRPKIGLALSGGGSRAIAFHLGCLRALHDRGILKKLEVISAVSGGSVIAGMYAYGRGSFEEFDARVVDLLRRGLTRSIARQLFVSPMAIRAFGTALFAGAGAVGASLARNAVRGATRVGVIDSQTETRWSARLHSTLRRTTSRTSAFEAALDDRLFRGLKLTDRRRGGIDVVFNACELRTGTAFRFGSRESACWRFGKLRDNNIPVSLAVAASAAYPAFLPAIDTEMRFTTTKGERTERVIITDGGVYDNLGLSCLEPGRSPEFSSNVFDPEYILCCDAGPGQFDDQAYPFWWPGRMQRSFETTFRSGLTSSQSALHSWAESGRIRGFALVYLGQQDHRLPYTPPDLVPRDAVIGYPTNFSPMTDEDIDNLTRRGEQLARLLISHYVPEL